VTSEGAPCRTGECNGRCGSAGRGRAHATPGSNLGSPRAMTIIGFASMALGKTRPRRRRGLACVQSSVSMRHLHAHLTSFPPASSSRCAWRLARELPRRLRDCNAIIIDGGTRTFDFLLWDRDLVVWLRWASRDQTFARRRVVVLQVSSRARPATPSRPRQRHRRHVDGPLACPGSSACPRC